MSSIKRQKAAFAKYDVAIKLEGALSVENKKLKTVPQEFDASSMCITRYVSWVL